MTKPNGAISEWHANADTFEVNWLLHAFERACTSLLTETTLNRGQFVIGDDEIRNVLVNIEDRGVHVSHDLYPQ